MMDDSQLLQEYVNGSEPAFRELVTRHINLVYSAALRYLADTPLVEDVVQTVFTALARKARALPTDVVLGGWLYRHTCFVAAQTLRTERRRQARERQAVEMNAPNETAEPDWEKLSPVLDEAMQHLSSYDRNAVVLRFFEGRDLRHVGTALGLSEEAARKRITRALVKLRSLLVRRGVTLSVSTLATMLAGHAVSAAPAGMAIAISSAALASAAAGTGLSLMLINLISMTKIKTSIIVAAIAAAIVTPVVLYQVSQAGLNQADRALQQKAGEKFQLEAEKARLAANQRGRSGNSATDLARLRNEAAALRQQTNALGALQKDNRRLQAAANQPDVEPTPEQQQLVMARMNYGKTAVFACIRHAQTNQGTFPKNMDQIAPALPAQMKAESDPAGDGFELLYHGPFKGLSSLANPAEVIIIRQTEPTQYGNRWAKVYVCADGHSEVHTQAEKDFAAWEEQHKVPSQSQ